MSKLRQFKQGVTKSTVVSRKTKLNGCKLMCKGESLETSYQIKYKIANKNSQKIQSTQPNKPKHLQIFFSPQGSFPSLVTV